MKTLRLLFWLRWRIAMNTTSRRGRWAAAAITAVLALAFAPLYLGAAVGCWLYASKSGANALVVVFGLSQLAIVWTSLLAGALGRSFELDKLKRYPLRAREVFGVNVVASLLEPVVLMTVPSLVAACVGVARHSGALAALQAAVGVVLLLLVTASALQLLLALVDDLLRREWMRYVAAFLFTLTVIGFQLMVGRAGDKMMASLKSAGFTPERMLEEMSRGLAQLPTAAAPAAVAGAAPQGPIADPLAGLIVSVALIAFAVWLGGRIMWRAVLRGAVGTRIAQKNGARKRGPFALPWPGLSKIQSLLATRELIYMFRTPAILYQMIVMPLTVTAIAFIGRHREAGFGEIMPLFIMTSTLAARNLMLWGYDGAGIRTLFLLPFQARDLVLSKNVAWLAGAFLEAAIAFGVLAAVRTGQIVPQLPLMVSGYLAVVFVGASLGTWVSIAHPKRAPTQGVSRRSPGGVVGIGVYLAVLVVAAALVFGVVVVRKLAPDAADAPAALGFTSFALVVCVAIWWLSMTRHADELERQRERMVGELAKASDD